MIFTKIFGTIGIAYIVMSLIDIKYNWIDKLYFKIWGNEPPQKNIYCITGLLNIILGLLLDFFVWLFYPFFL